MQEANKLFDLGNVPLLRASVLKLAKHDHRLYLTFHHLTVDATSINRQLLPKLVAIYEVFAAGQSPVV